MWTITILGMCLFVAGIMLFDIGSKCVGEISVGKNRLKEIERLLNEIMSRLENNGPGIPGGPRPD